MAYSDFSLDELESKFGIKNKVVSLLAPLSPPMEPSQWLKDALKTAAELPVRTEKAKSELIVLPLLLELRNRNSKFFTIYSGDNLNADEARGLKGECDFILAKDTGSFNINYPIIQIVEAKKNDIEIGVPQCAAQMLGAKLYNQKKNTGIDVIHGCVTTGDDWLFLKLADELLIDNRKYYLGNMHELLAVFQSIIDFYQEKLR